MSKVGVPGWDKAMNEVAQVWGGANTGAAQAFAAHDRAPDLHLVEPRARGGQPGESNLGTLGDTPVQHGLVLMIARVVHHQLPATVGGAGAQRAQEVTKLQISMALVALRE